MGWFPNYRGNFSSTANTNRLHSPNVWWDVPLDAIIAGYRDGYYDFDDFGNFGIGATDAVGQYKFYIDTSNTVSQLATEVNGVVRLLTDATDNDAPVLQSGGGTAGEVKFVSGGSSVCFEARVRVGATITEQASFIGLAEEACTADNGLISDNPDTDIATVMADKDYVGFANFTNAAPVLAFCYKKAGGTDTVKVASAHTIVASTFVKVGFKYTSKDDKLTAYVNGLSVGSYDLGDLGTTDFPSGEELARTIGFKNGSAGARNLDIDWWAISSW